MSQKRILITGSGGPLGVNVTRSLKDAPEPLYLLGTEANRYHVHLSLTDETALIPPAREREAYYEAMRGLIASKGIELIIPTHPAEVQALSEARDALGVRMVLPAHQTIVTAQDKWLTYCRLAEAGVPVPRTYHISSEADLERCFGELDTRPIWVRGAGTPGAKGIGVASLPCREVRHASAWVDHHRGWGYFIASEYLPGRNMTWCGLYDNGTLVASQTRERLEYVIPHVSPSGITGAPAVSRTVVSEAVHEVGDRAVRVVDERPNGVFFVDFKEDAAGTARVTEINAGRFGTTIHFYTAAGANFPYMLVKLAYGEPVPGAPLIDPIAPNTYWIRTLDCGPALVRKPGEDW